jgi:site-specific DNA-cytosine methylase
MDADVMSIASSIGDSVEIVSSVSDMGSADMSSQSILDIECSENDAESTVLALLAASPQPPWVQAAVAVFGLPALGNCGMLGRKHSVLHRRPQLRVVHDCRGIDAVSEALRHLHVAGLLLEMPTVIAASERCAAARVWTRVFHPPVPVEYHDMCHKEDPTPAADLYCNGFPCTPFSTRRGNKSSTFDDPNARPFWATLSEIATGKHKAILLENVCGLLTRMYDGDRCIDVLMREVRKAAAHRYLIHLAIGVGPDAFGEACRRPRVFVRMMLKTACVVDTEDQFAEALSTADQHVARVAMSMDGVATTAGDRLEAAGLLPRTSDLGIGFCPCCLPLWPGRPLPSCAAHEFNTNRRTTSRRHRPSWIDNHQQGWARLQPQTAVISIDEETPNLICDRPPKSYFTEAYRRHIPAGVYATTSRLRNLVELVAHDLWAAGTDPFSADTAFDASQSYGRHALRTDGRLPTLATSSRIWLMKYGVVLAPDALLHLMGFPVAAYRPRLPTWSDTELRRFVGNTMHPAAVGTMLASLLNLMKGDDAGAEDDE